MHADEALAEAKRILRKAQTDSPALDAEILLAHVLKTGKETFLTHPETPLSAAAARRFFALVTRRAEREPVAYIVGKKEFYGLDFIVNKNTLIPRPETETLIEAVLKKLPITHYSLPITIIDVGTGSGAIAVALAKKIPKAQVYATDISNAALQIAKKNAAKHKTKIIFKKGDLLEPMISIIKNYSLQTTHYKLIITANLPYVPTREWKTLQPEITKYEPRHAVDGGRDGLKYYRQLFSQLKKLPVTDYQLPITVFLEFDPEETTALRALIKRQFPTATVEVKKDLAGKNRIIVAIL